MHKLTRTYSSDSTFDSYLYCFLVSVLSIVFSFPYFYIISTTIDYSYVLIMLSIHAKLFSHLHAIGERESGSKHAMNCVYLNKVENSSYHQNLNQIQCQSILFN